MDLMNPMNPLNMVNPASPWYHVWNAQNDDAPVTQAVSAASESGDAYIGIFALVLVVIAFGWFLYAMWTDIK